MTTTPQTTPMTIRRDLRRRSASLVAATRSRVRLPVPEAIATPHLIT
jgi:hypothetical protein